MHLAKLIHSPFFLAFIATVSIPAGAYPIIAYTSPALTKLLITHAILLTPLFLANFYIFKKLSKLPEIRVFSLVSFVSSCIFIIYLLSTTSLGSLNEYLRIGDFLRDYHDINWYTLDYSGWLFLQILYFGQIINFIIFSVGLRIYLYKPTLKIA